MGSRVTRRRFFQVAGAAAGTVALGQMFSGRMLDVARAQAQVHSDDAILRKVIEEIQPAAMHVSMGEIVALVGRQFVGSTYAAHTLEADGEEHLVVNLRSFDCVTFIESTLALARTLRLPGPPEEVFRSELQRIRYRGGTINGYTSRLHYFSDWLSDNEKKGIVRDMTRMLDGVRDKRGIHYMSSHRSSYRQLALDRAAEAVAATEKRLSVMPRFLVPAAKISSIVSRLENGDLIGVATAIDGLDVSHTGMVVVDGSVTRFLHASESTGVVELTQGSLVGYLDEHARATGIIVARPLEAGV